MPSPECGMALGIWNDGGRPRHVMVKTRDNGRTWAIERTKPEGRSIFFLRGGMGWMAAEDGIYATTDCGAEWRRLRKEKDLVRVCFSSERTGYALGAPKKVLKTVDGGETWTELPAAQEPKSNPDRSAYTWADFHPSGWGMIVGFHKPARRAPDAPVWMDPETAAQRRQWPSLSLILQTPDGGVTWRPSVESVLGTITRVRFSPSGSALVLLEFEYSFEFPSDVMAIGQDRKGTARVYRRKNHAVTDVIFDSRNRAYVAGYEPPGQLRDVPIPGKVKISRSPDMQSWDTLDVDYRAVGRRVMLAAGSDGVMWAATDTGMILRLTDRE
ncbi:MAG: hypothetical protein R2762_30310 [Bryobacteraceae bacterium]